MINISIAKDFSDVPAGRFLDDGDYTGEKFRKEFLVPALKDADKNNPVSVDINDIEGCGSSFLEEAFGGLIREEHYTKQKLDEILKIKADEEYEVYKKAIELHIEKAQ